ncbi:GNAT family N-acetyltransferase [Natrinema halophilum]|uniref:GNAT family N-acetyltransferase n=1 Tax=Natrinema halophilum TaxID=1699371 RepID=A0A7D5KZJ5_9EURY|nr:GNAT family N-acetyltransferase [Natrinema halophilum]QLG49380.1 GNAT family N-acetyltransferase [Natrinema halophilum]
MNAPLRTATRYTVRTFAPDDRAAFLSLYETVFGHDRSPRWFRWKFRENPYVDHVPIIVATSDGDPVGFRSFFAQQMRIGGTVRTAFQPCDTMVHPRHRGRGLFGRMNEHAIERYANGSPSFFFNFPNENSKPGNLAHGWQEIGTVPAYYRLQNPADALERRTNTDPSSDGTDGRSVDTRRADGDRRLSDGRLTSAFTDMLEDTITRIHRAGDRLLVDSEPGLGIEYYETPPTGTLAAIYRRSIPPEIHTNRTAAFYRWRFANPAQTYLTYVARRDGEPVAALVVSSGVDRARIVETLPRSIEPEEAPLNQLLVAAMDDFADRRYVTAFGETVPSPLRYRFYPDTRLPLSAFVRPTSRTLLARDLGDGLDLESSPIEAWTFSRLDLDTT